MKYIWGMAMLEVDLYKTTNTVNNYQFRFSVDCETLSITSFESYYYSKEQGEQALAWLNDKYMQKCGE